MATLTRDEITQALEQLGKLARSQSYTVKLLVVGGSAMVLLYNARPATRDVDVVILSPQASIVRNLAQQVAEAQDLSGDWLNDGAKGYVVGLSEGKTVFFSAGHHGQNSGSGTTLGNEIVGLAR